MTCKEFRKFLYAFSDGELATRENLEVLEHLNMCPSCSRKVSIQQELRTVVAGLYRDEAAPAALHERVLAGLQTEAARSPWRRVFRVFIPLAMAAVLAVIVGPWIPGRGVQGEGRLVQLVATRHEACCRHWATHQAADLPRQKDSARKELAEEYGFAVIAPKLPGYEFQSANRCGLKGHPGSHLLYKAVGGEGMVSVFSVEPALAFAGEARARGGKAYHLLKSDAYGVLGWNEGGVSHVLCSDCPPEELLDLVAPKPVAGGTPPGALMLAAYTPGAP